MEQIRIFERKCLRACLERYRTRESNYQKYIKNKVIYDLAEISRFDNFIIKLIRNYFAETSTILENSLIFPSSYVDENYIKRTLIIGFVPPEAFIYLDKNGYIQDKKMIPIIYHIPGRKNQKTITYPPNINSNNSNIYLQYSLALPDKDVNNNYLLKNQKKYWWRCDDNNNQHCDKH